MVFEAAEEPDAPGTHGSAGKDLLRRVGPQVVFQEIRDKMASSTEQKSFGNLDLANLKRELVNADREYRYNPGQYPRRLKVYGKLPDRT